MERGSSYEQIIAELDGALAALERVRDGVMLARDTLAIAEADLVKSHAALIALGAPMTTAGAGVVAAIAQIGAHIEEAAPAPSQLAWLTGEEVLDVELAALRTRAEQLLAWLEPRLAHVSPRTRTAVRSAILGATEGRAPRALVERLTPENFAAELQRPSGGSIGSVQGVGPRSIGELRAAFGVRGAMP